MPRKFKVGDQVKLTNSHGKPVSFIEDCAVCCRPIQYEVTTNADDEIEVIATRSE